MCSRTVVLSYIVVRPYILLFAILIVWYNCRSESDLILRRSPCKFVPETNFKQFLTQLSNGLNRRCNCMHFRYSCTLLNRPDSTKSKLRKMIIIIKEIHHRKLSNECSSTSSSLISTKSSSESATDSPSSTSSTVSSYDPPYK